VRDISTSDTDVLHGVSHRMDTEISAAHLNPGVSAYLKELFPKIVEEMPGCEIAKYSLKVDHVHMVMVIRPNMQ